jgi:hypothetical protein
MENLILQGGALAVILLSFLTVLGWLLKHFTTALNRIESAIHACTLSNLHLAKVTFQANMAPPDGHTDEILKQSYKENLHTMREIESTLASLIKNHN